MVIKLLANCSIILILFSSCNNTPQFRESADEVKFNSPNNEVIYHMVQRSFYDSNGDSHGDLNGIREKLNYLQELGVTSILLLPLYESIYHHNYFTGNFEKIDEEFGTMQDYQAMLSDIHDRGMKFYMDMETQYVTEDHPWFKDSYQNPASPYSDYLVYNGPGNTRPETIIFDLTELKGYNDSSRKITTVNLNNEKVKEYFFNLYKFWVDPNGDGNFSDGVDGFRLDHMMDDLDNKGKWTNLFQNFWKPLIAKLRAINPKLVFIAEQANWASLGLEYLEEGLVDRVFAFRIAFEIRNFNKQKLENMADSIFGYTPRDKQQIVFLENHDMPRFSFMAKKDQGKLKVGAALNILIGGIPSIYYGQEIGMYSKGGNPSWGMTDGLGVPDREAFEWYAADSGKGMATWYRNTGPWWDSTNLVPNDGISYEEQRNDPASLWYFYKQLIQVRRNSEPLVDGLYKNISNNSDSVFSFLRYVNDKSVVVAVNFSGSPQKVSLDLEDTGILPGIKPKLLLGSAEHSIQSNKMNVSMNAHDVVVWEWRK